MTRACSEGYSVLPSTVRELCRNYGAEAGYFGTQPNARLQYPRSTRSLPVWFFSKRRDSVHCAARWHCVATRRGAWYSCFAKPQFGPSKLTVDTLVQFTVMQDKVARLTEGENSVEIRIIESDDEAREAECAPSPPVPHPRRDLPTSAPGLAAGTTS
jgi:hypothetical protein